MLAQELRSIFPTLDALRKTLVPSYNREFEFYWNTKHNSFPMSLPNRVIAIENSDKINNEKWTKKRLRKDIGNWPNPQRFIISGPCGTGKSTMCKNLILHQKPAFKRIILIHADIHTTEYDDLGVTTIMDELPTVDYFNFDGEPWVKTAVILDDIEFSNIQPDRLRNIGSLFRYVSTHKGITLYLMHQDFSDVPKICRKNASVFICYEPRARLDLALIDNRTGLEKGTMRHLFKRYTRKPTDSICIDCSGSPFKLRKNVWEPIAIGSKKKNKRRRYNPKNNKCQSWQDTRRLPPPSHRNANYQWYLTWMAQSTQSGDLDNPEQHHKVGD